MTQFLFLSAGLLAFTWLLVHLFAGGRTVVSPAFATETLDPIVRDTLYICWHFTSVGIFAMAALFLAASAGGAATLAMVGTGLAAGFFAAGILVQMVVKQPFKHLPQGWLFLPVTLLGIGGLIA